MESWRYGAREVTTSSLPVSVLQQLALRSGEVHLANVRLSIFTIDRCRIGVFFVDRIHVGLCCSEHSTDIKVTLIVMGRANVSSPTQGTGGGLI